MVDIFAHLWPVANGWLKVKIKSDLSLAQDMNSSLRNLDLSLGITTWVANGWFESRFRKLDLCRTNNTFPHNVYSNHNGCHMIRFIAGSVSN